MTPDYNHPAVVQLMAAENEIERLRGQLDRLRKANDRLRKANKLICDELFQIQDGIRTLLDL